MAHNYDVFPESKFPCPYNIAHNIEFKDLFVHLQKCSKSNPNRANLKCPFNSLHVHSSTSIVKHINECPDRYYAETASVQYGDAPVGFKPPPIKPLIQEENEENWDSDVLPTSVLNGIEEDTKEKCLLLSVNGKTKSERKEIRRENVRKFRDSRQ